MRQPNFLNHKHFRWFWINVAVVLFLAAVYYFQDPIGGRNGGTYYGYATGTIATAAILYLMWFGIRKRSYYAHLVPLKGWLAAHVWVGIALLAIVPLHAAFQFGINIHTLAYVILCLVVLSGIWGAINYRVLPRETMSNRGGGSIHALIDQVLDIDTQLKTASKSKGETFTALITALDFHFKPSLWSSLTGIRTAPLNKEIAAARLSAVPEPERHDAINAMTLIGNKRELAERIEDEISVRARLRLWLFLHIPLSIALVLLVAMHIVTVFYFY